MQINFTDQQFKTFLENINQNKTLKILKLQHIFLDTDFKINIMNGFLAGNKKLIKVKLSHNMLNNMDILS